MQARSALFDLYGDHLRSRGGRAPVAALVKLLTPLDIAPPAVRTAVSRMVRQGWLAPLRLPGGPGYTITPRAARRLDEAAARIYRTGKISWDGRFDLIVLTGPQVRRDRQRLWDHLAFLGYGRLDEQTWVAPRPGEQIDNLLTDAGVHYERFNATHTGGTPAAMGLVRRAWDLAALGRAYEQFVAEQRALLGEVTSRSSDGTRTRRGSGSSTPGAPSSSATRSCRRRCCRTAGPVSPPRTSSTGTPPACGRPPTATSSIAWV